MLQQLKYRIRAILYAIAGFIMAIIFVRILLKMLGANDQSAFVDFWYTISDFFVSPFRGIYSDMRPTDGNNVIEVFSFVAMMVYALLGLISSKTVTSVTNSKIVEIFKSFTDSIFKIIEFFLIARFILKMTSANTVSSFVTFIYTVSSIVYEPFADMLPTINIEQYNIVIETSTLIAIIIVIVFDVVTEGVIDRIAGPSKPITTDVKDLQEVAVQTIQVPMQAPQQPAQAGQNITINVPQAPVGQPTVDTVAVEVASPPQASVLQQPASTPSLPSPTPTQTLPNPGITQINNNAPAPASIPNSETLPTSQPPVAPQAPGLEPIFTPAPSLPKSYVPTQNQSTPLGQITPPAAQPINQPVTDTSPPSPPTASPQP